MSKQPAVKLNQKSFSKLIVGKGKIAIMSENDEAVMKQYGIQIEVSNTYLYIMDFDIDT